MPPRPARHGEPRPYQPDTGAAAAEEFAARRALAEGRLALAPRASGWVEVWTDAAGVLVEAPLLDEAGRTIDPWDTEALARWMRNTPARAARGGLLLRLRRLAGFRR